MTTRTCIAILIGMFSFVLLASSLSFAQTAGDAMQCNAQSYFNFSYSEDSLYNCTIELWVNPTQNSDNTLLFYIGEPTSSGFGLFVTTLAGAPDEFCEIRLGGIIESVTGNQCRLPLNSWTHLALTRAGNLWKFYKNGSLVGRGKGLPKKGPEQILIGKGFSGMIDEIKVWNRELLQSELRASMAQSLQGNENDLRLYYTMDSLYRRGDSVIVNKVMGSSLAEDAHLVVQGRRTTFIPSSLVIYSTPAPQFSLLNFPSHMQFYSRADNGFAPVIFDGNIDANSYDSIILEKRKNDIFIERWSYPLDQVGSFKPFHFTDSIYAERSQYTYSLYINSRSSERFIAEAADLIAGDAFFIGGQSNAHPAIDWYSNVNPFFRTFGIQTSNLNLDDYEQADTSWGYGNAHGFGGFFAGPYLIGVWANKLEGNILTSYGIPTCIINGAGGGSTIEQNLPNAIEHSDLHTIYGRAFYRSVKSGLQKKYKAIFWYQGEYNSVDGYYNNFRSLYDNWFRDYGETNNDGVLKKIYLFQIHPGCVPGERSALRELQRTIPDSLPHIEVMSTCGISGHIGCHYDGFGYWHIADNIYRLVAHDFYGSGDTTDIYPPNIRRASYGNSTNDLIILKFPNVKRLMVTDDTLIHGMLRELKEYFYLDSVSGEVQAVYIHGDSVILQLASSSQAKYITYLPDETYNNDDSDIYEGPWILNSRGVGALSFSHFPISPYVPDTVLSDSQSHLAATLILQCFPNPVRGNLTITFSLSEPRLMQFDLFDLLGKLVLPLSKRNAGAGENIGSYDLSVIADGEYTLRIIAGSDVLYRKIIIVK